MITTRVTRVTRGFLQRSVLVTLFAVSVIIACEEVDYVYTARKYDPDAACLDPYKPIEVVPGDSVSASCPMSCLTVGKDTFVSTVCPPLPTNATALEMDAAECIAALSVQDATCGVEEDGGEDDGGEEEEDAEAEDTGADAGTEAGPADAEIDAPDAD